MSLKKRQGGLVRQYVWYFVLLIGLAIAGTFYALQPKVTDHVPNNSAEQASLDQSTPMGWEAGNWGTNTAAFSYETTGYEGSRSLRTEITSYTDGDAKWAYNPQPLLPNKEYTFIDYYKSNVTSETAVEFTLQDGTKQYLGLKDAPAASDWTKYRGSFTTPVNVKAVTVFHTLATVGFLITDDYHVIDYVPEPLTRGLVTITFDDGGASQYTKAYPILTKYSLPATFYLVSGTLNKPGAMTISQAMELKNAGHHLAAHTVSHPNLTKLSDQELHHELTKSQQDLQVWFGESFSDFCTPYGAYDERVISLIKKYYRSHRTVLPGYNSRDNFDVYGIKVQNVLTTTTPEEVQSWVNKAVADKTWLVLVYHQVDNPYDGYSVTSVDFDQHMQHIKTSGLGVVTKEQGINEVLPQIES